MMKVIVRIKVEYVILMSYLNHLGYLYFLTTLGFVQQLIVLAQGEELVLLTIYKGPFILDTLVVMV